MDALSVGLFGTCGGSRWRDSYKAKLAAMRLDCFDPQVMPETHGRAWCEADIENELRHLDNDDILLFKATGETASHVTLLEVLRAVHRPKQFVIVVIEDLAVDYREFDGDPCLAAMEQALVGEGMLGFNPLRDAHVARTWTRKQVLASDSILVSLADNDDHALAMIKTCRDFLAAKAAAADAECADP